MRSADGGGRSKEVLHRFQASKQAAVVESSEWPTEVGGKWGPRQEREPAAQMRNRQTQKPGGQGAGIKQVRFAPDGAATQRHQRTPGVGQLKVTPPRYLG